MAWAKGTIKLAAARSVFCGVEFEEVMLGGERVGYAAIFSGKRLENASLTTLCRALWLTSMGALDRESKFEKRKEKIKETLRS